MNERDKALSTALSAEVRRARVARKNVHNFVTAALFILSRWFFVFAALLAMHQVADATSGLLALFAAGALLSTAAVPYFVLLERASLRFKRLAPTIASIYDPYFWSHERHWKLSDSPIVQLFAGTPLQPVVLRMLGAKVGRKVFDAGCSITERSLVDIGDYANLNEGSVLQAHSLEEGVFKSDTIRLAPGVTLGPGAFAHYGVGMGERAVLDADSFLMKGEVVDADSVWRGNPARMIRSAAPRAAEPPARKEPAAFIPSEAAE
jgi:non-ribosomal peptide synthetase-like protein